MIPGCGSRRLSLRCRHPNFTINGETSSSNIKAVKEILDGKRFPWVIHLLSRNDTSLTTGEREGREGEGVNIET
jgi:hypothetical protein